MATCKLNHEKKTKNGCENHEINSVESTGLAVKQLFITLEKIISMSLKHLLIFTFLLTSSLSYSQRKIDVLHYNFEIEVSDASDTIHGRAAIRLQYLQSTNTIRFDLKTTAQGKGMYVLSVTGPNLKEFKLLPDSILISLTAPSKASDTATFFITYSGIPADGLIISKNKYGHRTFFADNWPNRGHNWIPCVDEPGDKSAVDFIVTAPQHYQVVSNGIQIEETNLPGNKKLSHWKEDVAIGTKVMVIGVAEFAVSLSGIVDNCIPVYSWIYPEDRDKGFYDYALATEILPFYNNYLGPYGYKKLANVQSKTTFGGLENANTIFYAENSVNGTRSSETLLAHEIAHQWFGNMATEKTFAHLWLSEGFATYMTILYMEKKYGTDTARAMLEEDRMTSNKFSKSTDQPVIDNNTNYMALLNANNYPKGGWILHMLRRQLGDSVFHRSIRNYYATYAGKNADTEDLQKIFEKESGKDLSLFFKQWLYTGGNPIVNIKWSYDTKTRKISITVKQEQKNVFQFPLEIAIISATGKSNLTIKQNITQKEQTFSVPFNEKISKLVADPNTSLLFDSTISPN